MKSAGTTLIKLRDVSMVRDRRHVLSDVNMTVRSGDFIAITGPNGGGKTTLLRIILKLLHPTSGSVTYYNGTDPVQALSIGYLPQKNMIDERFPITVTQVIASGLLSKKGIKKEEARSLTEHAIELTGLRQQAGAAIGQLSGGQLQRALLGRALVSGPKILVLDEPLSYLDKSFEARMYDIIADYAPKTTIILVSHEMSKIASMANRHLIVNRTIQTCTASHHYFIKPCQ